MDVVGGINEKDLAHLIVEIINMADKVNIILNKYDDRFSELKSVYQGKPYDEINAYYNTYLRPKFYTVKNNVISYANDLTALNRKMHEGATTMANVFAQKSDDFNLITKKLNDYVEELNHSDNL
ncbi:MAG: hypothetical protein IKX00_04670 [Bacilli bacterium]|nr:hypothetical protein [Bacilli bacterium]